MDLDQINNWINTSDLAEEKKAHAQEYLKRCLQEAEVKDFQISCLKRNLRINTRFLNKTVEDLENTVKLLKESNHQLNNFTRIASHDLKSPLRSISSFSALLNKGLNGKLDKKQEDYLEIIESSAKSMSELIDDLLTYTRINEESLNIKDENLSSLVNEVLLNLDFDINNNQVKIENKLPDISINCDSIKTKQVFQNIIANSIKFSSHESNNSYVILDMDEEDDRWVFSIEDNGIGIGAEFKELVFQEFQKLNGTSFEGTGMGLSIVKNIVTKHKGHIWIDPAIEKGTKVVFTISKQLSISNAESVLD